MSIAFRRLCEKVAWCYISCYTDGFMQLRKGLYRMTFD